MSRVKPRSAAAGDITEAELQRAVIDLARSLGWGTTLSARKALVAEVAELGVPAPPLDGLIYHPRYSLGSEPGWPDLTLIRARDRRLVFAELKAAKGVVSTRQAEVLELLRSVEEDGSGTFCCGKSPSEDPVTRVEVHVWRPSDLASGAITEVLR